MIKASIVCIAGILFLSACENSNSSTIGTYEQEETSAPSEIKEDTAKEATATKESENDSSVSIDTLKNNQDSVK